MPAGRESLMYLFIASLSPNRRDCRAGQKERGSMKNGCMAQSYGLQRQRYCPILAGPSFIEAVILSRESQLIWRLRNWLERFSIAFFGRQTRLRAGKVTKKPPFQNPARGLVTAALTKGLLKPNGFWEWKSIIPDCFSMVTERIKFTGVV